MDGWWRPPHPLPPPGASGSPHACSLPGVGGTRLSGYHQPSPAWRLGLVTWATWPLVSESIRRRNSNLVATVTEPHHKATEACGGATLLLPRFLGWDLDGQPAGPSRDVPASSRSGARPVAARSGFPGRRAWSRWPQQQAAPAPRALATRICRLWCRVGKEPGTLSRCSAEPLGHRKPGL